MKKNNIIIYDLENQQKIGEIKYHHKSYITNFQHITDIKNKRDLCMSVSCEDNNIFIWDLNKLGCILNILNINNGGILYSACFLNDNNNIYILTSNSSQSPFYINFEPIKIFDLNGQKIKEIKNSNDKTYYFNTYYDNTLSKNYIITCNFNYIKSYDYENNELYKKYYDKDDGAHYTFIIYNNENNINLIESSNGGLVRIWTFHTGQLINKINLDNQVILRILSICLWNNNYLFAGCTNGNIKLIDIQNGNVVKNLEGDKNIVLTIKKINHPKYGECIISKGFKEDQIKLWILKNIKI